MRLIGVNTSALKALSVDAFLFYPCPPRAFRALFPAEAVAPGVLNLGSDGS